MLNLKEVTVADGVRIPHGVGFHSNLTMKDIKKAIPKGNIKITNEGQIVEEKDEVPDDPSEKAPATDVPRGKFHS